MKQKITKTRKIFVAAMLLCYCSFTNTVIGQEEDDCTYLDLSCISIEGRESYDLCEIELTVSYVCDDVEVSNLAFVWYFEDEYGAQQRIEGNSIRSKLKYNEPINFFVTAYSDNYCKRDERKQITVTVKPFIDLACIDIKDKNYGVPYCAGDEIELTASHDCLLNSEDLIFVWYDEEGKRLFEGNPFKRQLFAKDNKPTSYKYYVTTHYFSCESEKEIRKEVVITVNPSFMDEFIVTGMQTICAGESTSLTVKASGVVNSIYRWYATATADAPFFTEEGESSTYKTSVLKESVTYYVTVEGDNFCENKNNRQPVTVTVNKLPEWGEGFSKDIFVCAGETVNVPSFTGTNLSSTSVTWTNSNIAIGLPASGTGNIPDFVTNINIAKEESAKIVIVPVSESGCKNLNAVDSLMITIYPLPQLPITRPVNILADDLPVNLTEGCVYCWCTDTTGLPVDIISECDKDVYYCWVRHESQYGCKSEPVRVTINILGCRTPHAATEETLSNSSLQIYPNPAKDELRIESGELSIEKVEVVDLSGCTVETWRAASLQNSATINISALPQGVYLIKVYTDKGLVVSKVMKE